MVHHNINHFEYGQLLSKSYSTVLRNEDVKEKVIDIFKDHINDRFFKENNIKPRVFINDFLLRYYPDETAIKSSFINNVICKSSNHVTIFELNVGNSRLDLCKINGVSTAYEIKTELDTPIRLKSQMKDYFRTFEKVYLVCPESKIDSMIEEIPEECGMYTYYMTKTGRYIFKKRRNAVKSKELSSYSQLLALTKRELQLYFDCDYLNEKESMVTSIMDTKSKESINQIFKKCLKDKFSKRWEFLLEHKSKILEIDYQWFYKNQLPPEIVYL